MTDRQLENASTVADGRPLRRLAESASRVAGVERGESPATIPTIGFSVLQLASRIEHWFASEGSPR